MPIPYTVKLVTKDVSELTIIDTYITAFSKKTPLQLLVLHGTSYSNFDMIVPVLV